MCEQLVRAVSCNFLSSVFISIQQRNVDITTDNIFTIIPFFSPFLSFFLYFFNSNLLLESISLADEGD